MKDSLTQLILASKKTIKKKLIQTYVDISKPIKIAPFEYKKVELHMLIGHSMTSMAIFSLKSFFFYSKIKIPVIIHDDGTLTDKEKEKLMRHINGLRIVQNKIDKKLLKKYTACKKILNVNQSKIIPFRLFHLPKQSNKKMIIVMDFDVLFLQEPKEVIAWIKKNDKSLFITDQDSYYGIDYSSLKKYKEFKTLLPKINCGFLCLNQEMLSQKKYNKISSDVLSVYKQESATKEQTYFADQLIMATLFSKECNITKRLNDNYFLYARHAWNNTKIPSNAICIHFSGPFKMEYYEYAFAKLKDKLKKQLAFHYA